MIDNRKVLAYLHDEANYKSTKQLNRDAFLRFATVGTVVSNKWEGWAMPVSHLNYVFIETESGYFTPVEIGKLTTSCVFRDGSVITETGLLNRGVKKQRDASGNIAFVSENPVKIKIKSSVKKLAIHVPTSIMLPYGTKYGCPIVLNNPKIAKHTTNNVPAGDYIVCDSVNGHVDFNTACVVNGGVFQCDYDTTRFDAKAVKEADAAFLKAVTVQDRYAY
jgi:hypothetical protein